MLKNSKTLGLKNKETPILVGWLEWCALPDLNLPLVKAKIDTGAKTSSLHAFNIETFKKNEIWYTKFDIHPIHRHTLLTQTCFAPLVDQRPVRSSSGHEEHRPVILTTISLGGQTWEIQVTLTNRESMGVRMLIGRQAMKNRFIVDPSKSFYHGKVSINQVTQHYNKNEKA